ncbi:MAG: hypothetical protein ABSF82_05570 [Candidatus Bathyarchaeia archaeon]
MRPIVWGFIICVIGTFFWFIFTLGFGVIYGISEAAGGPSAPSGVYALVDVAGLGMIFGIPAGIVGEIVRWRRGKKTEKDVTAPPLQQATPVRYCTQCGKGTQANLAYCGHCGAKL